jgi:pimeloyl-ACP methyl ester carboxylesterase
MTLPLIVMLLTALAATMLMLVVVVAVAQSLGKTPSPVAVKAAPEQPKAQGAKPRGVRNAANAAAETRQTEEKDAATRKGNEMAGVFALVASIGALVGSLAFFIDLFEGDVEPQISDLNAGALHGTMVNARNSDPVVLIVPGSGPTDRDGNNPMGLKTDAYRLLAEGLIDKRIASVRIDKRGMFGSKDAGDPNAVTPAAYVADIHAWIDTIKAARGEGSGCVFLLGHSEGALMATLAAQDRRDVCGLILVAGMGRPMGEIIREQLRANPANAPILNEAFAALAELEAGRRVDTTSMTPALLPLFNPSVQGYLISVLKVDPVEALRAARKETLVLQGDRDLQVSVDDARKLDAVRNTELRIIGGMNHVLKEAPEDRAGNLATYADPSLPLAKDVIRRIRNFVEDHE